MLKVKDYTIVWDHRIYYDHKHKMDNKATIPFYRAETLCQIVKGETVVGMDSARCSWEDNFNRDKGRKISLSRAMQAISLPRKTREMIWESYRFMGNKQRW